jgi:hypothetical protein
MFHTGIYRQNKQENRRLANIGHRKVRAIVLFPILNKELI